MQRTAQPDRECERDAARIFFEPIADLRHVLDRRIRRGEIGLIGIEQLDKRGDLLVQLRAGSRDGVDEAAGREPDLVAVAFLLRQIVDGDSLRGAGPVEHRHRIDQVLLEQHVLDRSRDAVVLAAGAGADHELDISFRFPGGLRV